jgi:DNA-binding CsgD family transcriptional regulator
MAGKMRPLERRITQLAAEGVTSEEIGRRFNRSADHIDRVLGLARLPGRTGQSSDRDGLRAVERRVLSMRDNGLDHAEIGRRFKRSAAHMRRIEGLAYYKMSLRLLGA